MKKIAFVKKYLCQQFKKADIDEFEVNVLLSEVLKVPFSKLVLLDEITNFQFFLVKHYAKKRVKGMPITKIFKRAYFYGLEFDITNDVLSPRQETELLVSEALKRIKTGDNVLDLCTGSGCIAVAIAKNSNANVWASDVSKKALKIAKKNAKKHNANVEFVQSNLFENINKKFDIIVSNPPYIETKTIDTLSVEVKKYDPILALDGGEDGLDFYKKIIESLPNYLNENGTILFEIGFNQAESVKKLLKQNSFEAICLKDYENKDRIIVGKRKN